MIADLIFYGLLAGAAIAGLAMVNSAIENHYVAPHQAIWDKKEAAYKQTITADETTIGTQGSSLATSLRAGGECTASLERIAGIADNAGKLLALDRAKAAPKEAVLQKKIDDNAAKAKEPATTADAACIEAKGIGLDYARRVLGLVP